MNTTTFAYRLHGHNYPVIIDQDGKDVASVTWQGDREKTIALTEEIVQRWNMHTGLMDYASMAIAGNTEQDELERIGNNVTKYHPFK